MLKTAYQIGLQQALREENVEQLLKEAQELGIDLEKMAFWSAAIQGLRGLGNMARLGWQVGARAGTGRALGAMRGLRMGWGAQKAFAPQNIMALKGLGLGAAGFAAGSMRSGGEQQPPPQHWYSLG